MNSLSLSTTLLAMVAAAAVPLVGQCELQYVHREDRPYPPLREVHCSGIWDPDGPGPQLERLVVGGKSDLLGSPGAVFAVDPVSGSWYQVGSNCNQQVLALLPRSNGELLVGGEFTATGDGPCGYVARWDGAVWQPLGVGCDGPVRCLEPLANGDIVVGGSFAQAGAVAASFVARWDGGNWSPMGAGFQNVTQQPQGSFAGVYTALELSTGDILVGGYFDTSGGSPIRNIGRWDGTAWSSMDQGLNSFVYDLAVRANGELIAVGAFLSPMGMARWTGTTWASCGSGLGAFNTTAKCITPLATGGVVVGGNFTRVATTIDAHRVVIWTGTAYSPIALGADADVNTVLVFNGQIHIGGRFTSVGPGLTKTPAVGVARWDGTLWRPVGRGFNAKPNALLPTADGGLYAAGVFHRAGNVDAVGVARWDGQEWHALGSGMGWVTPSFLVVPTMGTMLNGDLLVGGFEFAGGALVRGVARWDGLNWSGFGAGFEAGRVAALTADAQGAPVAGGSFLVSGGVPCQFVARWNGTSWQQLGSMNGAVTGLTRRPNGELIACGVFTQSAGTLLNGVARWDGASWQPLGPGLTQPTSANLVLALPNGDVVAAGGFTRAGNLVVNGLARWDGSAWHAMGSGLFQNGATPTINGLLPMPDGGCLLSGYFNSVNGQVCENIARWDGSSWRPVAVSGNLDNVVAALLADGTLAIAGGVDFQPNLVPRTWFATTVSNCPPVITSSGAGCDVGNGPISLSSVTPPLAGTIFRGSVQGLPANTLAVAVSGLSTLSMPLSQLLAEGQSGCDLLVSVDAIEFLVPAGGVVTSSLFVPASAAVIGLSLHHQVLPITLDAVSGIILQVAASNRLSLTIGDF